ncbi:MAG: hypothetical protein ACM3IJ_00930 [Candidatus Levyibacteriota bacterium]
MSARKSSRKKVSTPRKVVAKVSRRRSAPVVAVKKKPFNIFKLFEFWLVVPQ